MNNAQRSMFSRKRIAVAGACAMVAAGLIPLWSSGQPLPAEAAAVERAADENAPVQWFDSLTPALAEAKRTDKPILIAFTAGWCPPCQMMEKHVWPHGEVQSMLRSDVVPLRIALDGPKPPREAVQYAVEFLPTLVLANPQGKEIDRAGYVDREQLLEFVRRQLRS